ncbi:MAG: fructosamine kinase family protein [Actinomycetota bacterium]|nr:fructosamine kinase family protein [Actinomycetota bacterium]
MERTDLIEAIERALDADVSSIARVHGGDVAQSFRIGLAGGRTVFAKTHTDPPPHFFTTEASGLAWLAEVGAVSVPTPLAVSDGSDGAPALLVLEWIDTGRAVDTTDDAFGRQLAAMHDAGAPCFGRKDRRTTGSRRLPNEPHERWSTFFADCRLLPLARLAAESSALPDRSIAALERLAGSIDRFDDGGAPARLHGDLWAGNRVVDVDGESWLIDPAAHGGHREFDLAMMRLFGGFGQACFDAYADEHPLADGWQDRVPLHQIAPLVVHAIKFGGRYVAAASEAISRY